MPVPVAVHVVICPMPDRVPARLAAPGLASASPPKQPLVPGVHQSRTGFAYPDHREAIRGQPASGDGKEIDKRSIRIHDSNSMIGGRCHIEPPQNIDAEPITTSQAEVFDNPISSSIVKDPLESSTFDYDEEAFGSEPDAIAVVEAIGNDVDGSIDLKGHDPPDRHLRWWVRARISENEMTI